MQKYACQSNINLTKLHDGTCTSHEQEKLRDGKLFHLFINARKIVFFQHVKHLFA